MTSNHDEMIILRFHHNVYSDHSTNHRHHQVGYQKLMRSRDYVEVLIFYIIEFSRPVKKIFFNHITIVISNPDAFTLLNFNTFSSLHRSGIS